MEESSVSYRRSIAEFVKGIDRRKSNHQSQVVKQSPSTKDASVKKEMKRKKEENASPRSPIICIKKRNMSACRYRKSLNEQIEKGDGSAEDIEIDHSPRSDSEVQDTGKSMCLRCFKLKRKRNNPHHRFCSCSTQIGEELTVPSEDSEERSGETTQRGDNYDLCVKCKQPGSLMHCGGIDCKRSYHPSCLDPPLSDVPFGTWLCFCCLRKKMEFGVYSVSQGIESILDSVDDKQKEKHYLVKFKGIAHIHNLWIPRSQLLIKDSVLLTKFDKKQQRGQEIGWKHEWTKPHRLLQRRFLMPPEQIDDCSCGHGDSIEYCYVEWFVKWKGLGYEYATWEFENSEFLCSANGKALIDEFERRRFEAKKRLNPSQINKDLCVKENLLNKLSNLADGFPVELNNELLISVCNIINHWHKNQNAILIDDQEANVKSILFISHLLSYTSRPFLIISTIPSLSTWEAEFACLTPSINVIVYNGDKDAREMIRSLEFYEEGGCIMFKVLIASPDVIVEDLLYLNCLGWEGIVIDDCQKTGISKHFEQFAILSSEFRLLILNSVPKETVADYYKLLSFLDIKGQSSPHNCSNSDSSENGDELSILKKRLKHYIVHEGKGTSSIFLEYWVPVQLSGLQLKQYCNILTSNSFLLRSRSDYVEKLLDVLKSIRMCCDHPYLADHSLQDSLTSNLTEKKCLNVGVYASSKFQLLDNILLEMKKLGLKVLILIQPEASKYHSGHLLDDFLCERFGEASFAYIDKLIEKPKIGSILKRFNDAKSETFVTVVEKLACRPRIKLSSIDAVIIFNNDWNPVNDIKALKKITLCSQTRPVKIFRLYSPYTVEEKILCLAKDDGGIETDIENTGTKFRHSLLTWGASCLFNKLNELDSSNAHPESLVDESLLKEMLYILATPTEKMDNFTFRKCSNIFYAHISEDSYSRNIPLCGDKDDYALVHGDPVIFWSKLFETNASPHTCGSSPRTRHANAQISEKNDGRKVKLLSMPAPESLETQKASADHNVQLHTSNGNQMELRGEIKEGAADHISGVDKIFSKRINQILLNQGQETTLHRNQRNEEEQTMKRYHNSVLQSAANNTEAIKKLNKKISEELERFDLHVKLQRKKLVVMQIEARNKEKQIKDQWLENASKGMSIEPYESLPLADTGFKYENFNSRELFEDANDDESRCKIDPSTTAQNEVQKQSKRNHFQITSLSSEEFPKIPSFTSKEKMEDLIIEKKNQDSTTYDGHGVMKTEYEALSVTFLQNALNSKQGIESALFSDTTNPKESVEIDRNHARTDYTSSQSAHAHGAQEHADHQQERVLDRMHVHCATDHQQERVHFGAVIEHGALLCEEEPEQGFFQIEHAHNSPESEHALNGPESEHALNSPQSENARNIPEEHAHNTSESEHAHDSRENEHAYDSCESEHAHNSPQSEPARNSPESGHAHISCEPVACSGLRRVRPISNSLPETAQLNNLRTATTQPESSDFLHQLFAASQSIPKEEFKPDPFQNELTMLCHREFSISHSHRKRRLALTEEREKELEEVRKKYNLLVQNEEAVYNQRLKVIKELQCAVQKNQILAELFKSNFIDSEEFQGTSNFIQHHTPPVFSPRSLKPETNQVRKFPLLYTPPSAATPWLHSSRMSTPSCTSNSIQHHTPPVFSPRSLKPETNQVGNFPLLYTPPPAATPWLHSSRMSTPLCTSNSIQHHTPPVFSPRSLKPETNQVQNFPLLYTPPPAATPWLHSSRMSTPSCQMGLMQQLSNMNISEIPISPPSSNSALIQPFCPSLPRMDPPSVLVGLSPVPSRSLTSQGNPNQPVVQPLTRPTVSNIHLRAPAPHLRRFKLERNIS